MKEEMQRTPNSSKLVHLCSHVIRGGIPRQDRNRNSLRHIRWDDASMERRVPVTLPQRKAGKPVGAANVNSSQNTRFGSVVWKFSGDKSKWPYSKFQYHNAALIVVQLEMVDIVVHQNLSVRCQWRRETFRESNGKLVHTPWCVRNTVNGGWRVVHSIRNRRQKLPR
jgi:hypothetical protein